MINNISHNDTNDMDDALFDSHFQEHLPKNSRIATRYVRNDIDAVITDLGLLNMGKSHLVKLIDITSKGVLIETTKKLVVNQSLTLGLRFRTGRIFEIKAKVVRISPTALNQYGIKFDRLNNELGDYLLETQENLSFK